MQPTGEGEQVISIFGVLIDATVVAEGREVVNSRVRDASEILDAVRLLCLVESNFAYEQPT